MRGLSQTIHLNISIALAILFYIASSMVAHAQSSSMTPGAGGCRPGELCNPLSSSTISEFLMKIIEIILVFAVPIIVFFIIYAGFLFVTARGNENQIGTARTALTWAVIGGVIVLGANLILTVVQQTVNTL